MLDHFSAHRILTAADEPRPSLSVVPALLTRFESRRERLNCLSARETDVLRLVVQGASNRQMAKALNISVKTVEKHRGRMMRKLQVQTLPDLMRIWLQANPEELLNWTPAAGNLRCSELTSQ
ncbi:MAG: LuxR C-terminal-related transcriptional regulator [Planctomycetaceae bacterium]